MGVYYISDAAGSDTTGAGTLGNPWKTFGKAFTVAGDGDYIYVRGGTYDQDNHSGVAVYPGYSGITIENYNGETVNVIAPTYGFYFPAGIDRIVMRGIDFDQGSTAASTVLHLGRIFSAGNTVEDCVLKYTDEAASGLRGIQLDGQFNKILNCEIGKIGVLGDAGWGEGIWITANGTYNLIQGCRIYDCSHNCIDIEGGRNNVVRECDFSNAYWRCCGPNGITTGDKTNIFEDNVFHDNHGDTDWGSKVSGLQNASQHTIIRRNRFYDLVGVAWTISGGSLATCGENNYSYHNSSYNIYTENTSLSSALECNSPDPDNILFNGQVVNNIFSVYNDTRGNIYNSWGAGLPSGLIVRNNWWKADGDPQYNNPAGHDFTLKAGSPCLNAGVFLTFITSASNTSATFVVDDAKYFTDGMGVIQGDVIQVEGRAQTARIISINYNTNSITVNTPLTWLQNEGLTLAYNGAAPDMGYYEHPEGGGGGSNIYFGNIGVAITPDAASEGTTSTPPSVFLDPGFEEWDDEFTLTWWTQDYEGGTTTINRDGVDQHEGNYCARIDVDSSGNWGSLIQFITMDNDNPRQFNLWHKSSAGTWYWYVYDDGLNVWLKEDGTWTAIPWYAVEIPNSTTWTQASIPFVKNALYTDYILEIAFDEPSTSGYLDYLDMAETLNEYVYVGSIPVTVTPSASNITTLVYVGSIPVTATPSCPTAYLSADWIPIPSGESVPIFVDDAFRIVSIEKNLGTMTCRIVAVKVSQGSEP